MLIALAACVAKGPGTKISVQAYQAQHQRDQESCISSTIGQTTGSLQQEEDAPNYKIKGLDDGFTSYQQQATKRKPSAKKN